MARTHSCPALLVAAPASGQGKTTVTAGLARLMARRGLDVRVFKCGPDFLDPHWHALASGNAADNLDLWINGEEDVRARLHEAAGECDLVLVEGVMGLFDGEPSAADLATRLGLPVLAVIDASAMAGTFAAIAHGLRSYRADLPWAGVLANRVGGAAHAAMLGAAMLGNAVADTAADAVEAVEAGWYGALPRLPELSLPERHLGLTVAAEVDDAMARVDAMADALAGTPLGRLAPSAWHRWRADFQPVARPVTRPLLAGRTVAVAKDAAFCFIYPANVDALRDLGARIAFFSPLRDEAVPDCDAVWLPGGYPELHAATVSRSTTCRESLAAHVAGGKPVWAECGGMMPLFTSLATHDGVTWPMWDLLPGRVRMHARLVALGPQAWETPQGTLRGHTFHHSSTESPLAPQAHTVPKSAHGKPEAIHVHGALRASYFHAWFASNMEATARLFLKDRE